MDIHSTAHAFELTKPLCDNFIKNPNKKSLELLNGILSRVNSHVFQDLQEYLTFPIVVHLQNSDLESVSLKMEMVGYLYSIFEKTKITKIEAFFKYFTCLLFQIYDKGAANYLAKVDEEFILVVVKSLKMLSLQISFDILEEVYSKKNAGKICQCVYLCLQIAQCEKYRTLRIEAIECIMVLAYVHDEADFQDHVLRAQVADVFMFFLPGIASGLQEIVQGDEKQGHHITKMSLRAWGRIIALVLADNLTPTEETFENTEMDFPSKDWKKDGPEGLARHMESTNRSKLWYQKTTEKLKILIENLASIVYNSSYLVRSELIKVCDLILENCTKNLKCLQNNFIEMLITLSEDEFPQVQQEAQASLERYSERNLVNVNKDLVENLEDNFFKLITKLPRIMNSTNETEQLSIVNLLAGYLKLFLKTQMPPLFDSSEHLEHLMMALICIARLDTSEITLLEDYTFREFDNIIALGTPWKTLTSIRNQKVVAKLFNVFQLLGQTPAAPSIIDYLQNRFENDLENRKEITLLINEIKSSDATKNIDEFENIIEMYLEPEIWYLPVHQEADSETVAEIKNNIIQMCLMVEGIGQFALVLREIFNKFLLKTLYFVLERAGNKHPLINLSGMVAIDRIRQALGLGNVTDLLKENADYFTHHVILKLRRVERHPGVLDVLAIIMRHCSIDILVCLKQIVSDVLLQSCDKFQRRNSVSFIRVFHTFMICVKRWQIENPDLLVKPEPEQPEQIDPQDQVEELRQILRESEEYDAKNKEKSAEEMYLEDLKEREEKNSQLPDNPYEAYEEIPKAPIPIEIQLTSDIIKRCLNFLPSKNKNEKLLVLDTLTLGVQIVQYWEDVLLPLVHLIWSPLVGRFHEINEPLIVHRGLTLLLTLSEISRDFIRHRTCKEVLPLLWQYLEKLAKNSLLQDRGAAYRYTQEYKLQLSLLENLATIVKYLDVTDEYLIKTIRAAIPYLSKYQPIPLQSASIKFYHTLGEINEKIVEQTLQQVETELDDMELYAGNWTKIHPKNH